ncbi:L-lactate dehydrogenase [Oceaniovalibus guishaninsula JLT2003]|uniref:L-lactate dehydrogenase n=1 Tax=Oceaniovalibus guishaninsula JLT2003 TaxID=1231392 RepID=K2HFQ5_9RHOB|nr:alpha-hydroxy acid oxidase [Oceaniovalibus guishaninsula]EKE45327.1 L-lactate dehydrogenase [Oceaniovalibus guishaninsula JLT2003]
MDLDDRYPSLSDLAQRARRRIPHFAWEYLDSATGDQSAHARSAAALDRTVLVPRVMTGARPDLTTRLMGHPQALPFGMAPVGMSGLIWPGAEATLATIAARHDIPYCLSNVAADTPENVGPHTRGQGWFQLYAPGDGAIRRDMLARARDSGFRTLVLTVDVPAASRRERQRRARLTNPMRITPGVLAQVAARPAWAMATARRGMPRLAMLDKYADTTRSQSGTAHAGYQLRTAPDWAYLQAVRAEWDGPLVVKGILHAGDAVRAAGIADAIWVSNHGGRQFEAAPAPAEVLPSIRAALGDDVPVIADGAVRSGTDVLRLIALGADFVMLGRAFHVGIAALGERGAAHVVHILRAGIEADLAQLGLCRPADARAALMPS